MTYSFHRDRQTGIDSEKKADTLQVDYTMHIKNVIFEVYWNKRDNQQQNRTNDDDEKQVKWNTIRNVEHRFE
jgi:hypothetical protein